MTCQQTDNHLVLLEHLNFKVPFPVAESTILDFFVQQLGCPECPTGRLKVSSPVTGSLPEGTFKQMHVNLGLSQVHFEWCTGDGKPYFHPQWLEGTVTIIVDHLESLAGRLKQRYYKDSIGNLIVTDPFGTTWVCKEADHTFKTQLLKFGEIRPGGVGKVLALLRVDFDCQVGVSKSIAKFYADSFNALARKTSKGFEIETKVGQIISFNETPFAPPANAYEIDTRYAIHMCFYVDNFEQHCRKMLSTFWVNPDYKIPPLNDNVLTTEGALERKQFRLKNIGPSWIFEHEIRDIYHPLSPFHHFLKQLKSKY